MMRRTICVTSAVFVGVVSAASGAFAQDGAQTGRGTPGNGEARTVACPVGCVRVHTPTAAEMARARQRRREQAERARAEEEQRRTQLEGLDRERATAAAEAQDAQRRAAEAQANEEQERARCEALERDQSALRAENEELHSQLDVLDRPATPARGGGPGMMRGYMPRVHFGMEGGLSGYTGSARQDVHLGGAWGLRLGVDFFRWMAVEARYFGTANGTSDTVASQGVTSVVNGGSGVLVLGIPLSIARVYGFAGVGAYHFDQSSRAAVTNSVLRNFNTAVVPMGVGVDVMLTRHFSVGAEGTLHYLIDHDRITTDLTANDGHIWTANGVLRFHL